MKYPTDEEIAGRLIGIISDGFNRSLGALEAAGAVDTKRLRANYKGAGSKFYDLVTEQITLTAKHGAPHVRQLFREDSSNEPKA